MKDKIFIGASLLAVVAASLCCTSPLIATIAESVPLAQQEFLPPGGHIF